MLQKQTYMSYVKQHCSVPLILKIWKLCFDFVQNGNGIEAREATTTIKEFKKPKGLEMDRANPEAENKWWWWPERPAWWCGRAGLSGDNQFCMISLFYFIDKHPGELNAIMARAADVCLVDDWLVWHLILWLTVKDGVMEPWEHPRSPPPPPPPPSPPLSLLFCSRHHFSIPSRCYISLTVLLHHTTAS